MSTSAYDKNLVRKVLQENLDSPTVRKLLEALNQEATKAEAAKAAKAEPAGPKPKYKFVVAVNPANPEVAWVLQIPEDESDLSAIELLNRGAEDFNSSKRGRLLPVTTMGEAIESVPTKTFGPLVKIKTKHPVGVIRLHPWKLERK